MQPCVPNYDLITIIDEDSATVMYRGHRDSDGLPVIIKTLKAERPNPRDVARLMHEYQVTKDLRLPQVVQVYGLERWDDTLALILEDFGGISLKEYLSTHRPDLTTALNIAIALATALEGIQQQHIIHKDIKPQNIIINPETGVVKITDFGIASHLTAENQRLGSPRMLEGTLAYMSPEQTGRMNRSVDYRTDFYSLGVTLYELLTGTLPFDSTEPMELVHSHIARRPLPPHEVTPSIPPGVSDIVMKLLAKTAEDRYRHAAGLKADLETCLQQWRSFGRIERFPLGRQDRVGTLQIPQKLYGRDHELTSLMAAFDRVHTGATELFLVSGYSGIGKSALINEIHKPMTEQRGHFITGKFDQYKRNIPYASIIQAFQELIQQLLTESAERLDQWKEALLASLGANAQVIIDVLPDLKQILGVQPQVAQLGPTESQNRFHMVFQHFVGVFASPEHPLVIFLDDLQWADLASLKLLQQLLTAEPICQHLLIIGAYRDNEVTGGHPLLLTLDTIRQRGTPVNEIVLQPLTLASVNQLLADMCGSNLEQTQPLAELVQQKTGGNPFFLNQFLRLLYEEQLLLFSVEQQRWVWDLARIHQTAVTDNVVALMTSKIQKLAPQTQEIVKLAACIGHQFDLKLLASVADCPVTTAATDLWEAIQEGLILPLDTDYKLLQGADPAAVADLIDTNFNVSYRFLHDRVHEAAYALLPNEQAQVTHLTIGRLLLEHTPLAQLDDQLFTIVNHLNAGISQITDSAERIRLAELDMNASRKAKTSAAYQSGVEYAMTGLVLLPEQRWEEHYDLTITLYQEWAECAYLSGQIETAEELFDTIQAHARSNLDRVQLYTTRSGLYATIGKFADGIAVGLAGLQLLGISYPETPEQRQAAVGEALGAIVSALNARDAAELLNAPVMTDPEKIATMHLLMALMPLAYNTDPALQTLLTLTMVDLSMRYGNIDVSAYGYVMYGALASIVLHDYPSAYAFGKLAVDLNERFNTAGLRGKIYHVFGCFIDHWRTHLTSSTEYLKQSYLDSLEAGDAAYAGFAVWTYAASRFIKGDLLNDIYKEANFYRAFAEQSKNDVIVQGLVLLQQVILNLQGRTKTPLALDTDTFREAAFVERAQQAQLATVISQYHIAKLQLAYVYGYYAEALEFAGLAETSGAIMAGTAFEPENVWYRALTLAALYDASAPEGQHQYREKLAQLQSQLQTWADFGPDNYRHRYLLLTAEIARIDGDDRTAADLYDRAIEAAHSVDAIHHEALANELAAKFYLTHGRQKIAQVYLSDAYMLYKRWGATAKVQALGAAYPALLADIQVQGARAATTPGTRTTTTSTTSHERADLLDMIAVLKVAQTISSEIVLDKLLERLMEIVVQNAGAQKGFLILRRDGQLIVESAITVDVQQTVSRPAQPIQHCNDLSVAIVQRVAETIEAVVLQDATHQDQVIDDPYITRTQPKSVLCVPLIHQGHLTGVLYLENNLATDVFTPNRIELIGLISSQAAIAIENALLYRRLQDTNQSLEATVMQRTGELSEINERLQIELVERQRIEAERAKLQEEIIRAQAATLAELSTPLIPITDDIMVMPLIGAMDTKRAQQVLETLLHGASADRAKVVIIDITGVPIIDTSVAGTLIRAAQALQLVGAQTIITGIRPEVAQTIVNLGLGLNTIVTEASLQRGIAYALGQRHMATLALPKGRPMQN